MRRNLTENWKFFANKTRVQRTQELPPKSGALGYSPWNFLRLLPEKAEREKVLPVTKWNLINKGRPLQQLWTGSEGQRTGPPPGERPPKPEYEAKALPALWGDRVHLRPREPRQQARHHAVPHVLGGRQGDQRGILSRMSGPASPKPILDVGAHEAKARLV